MEMTNAIVNASWLKSAGKQIHKIMNIQINFPKIDLNMNAKAFLRSFQYLSQK